MADRKISDLTALTTQASGDLLPIVDVSEAAAADKNKSITVEELFRGIPVSVGIGTSSPSSYDSSANQFVIANTGGGTGLTIATDTASYGRIFFADGTAGSAQYRGVIQYDHANDALEFKTADAERARIDSSGRLLVGTTSARTDFFSGSTSSNVQVEGSSFAAYSCYATAGNGAFIFGRANATNGSTIGNLSWQVDDGTDEVEAARIAAQVDGTHGSNDMPGRLVFSTTADGASSPTERLRITASGDVTTTGTSTFSRVNAGFTARKNDSVSITRTTGTPLEVNRQGSDGTIVAFYESNALEGTISVSGSTVSYNGAHLARWSQLPGGVERTEILRGSVLSNIDEMCEWGEEDNEQLNRMKVSDVEGDKNVSGVFQAWDDDDDTYTNDFYCAMTGDFVIRIGAGVTVERGDLLMSAGDGTAKPQDDDIIRSKTIAKVTSTNVSCTYDDGSYCVPCVLMAC